jgi:hypothetical protein
MNPHDKSWQKLVAAARRAPQGGDEAAPYGFSTRVAALAFENAAPRASAFARLSLRAVGVACLLAVAAVAANYTAIKGAFVDDDASAVAATSGDDPVAEVVDLGT